MGKVRIDVQHVGTLNIAKYQDIKVLRNLYRNYNNFMKLASKGNNSGTAIWIDLKEGLLSSDLSKIQFECIWSHLIEGNTLEIVAEDRNCSTATVCININFGIKKISNYLIGGKDSVYGYGRYRGVVEEIRSFIQEKEQEEYFVLSLFVDYPDKVHKQERDYTE